MFLDRQLRALETTKQALLVRDELKRRLVRLEVLAAKTACHRALAEAATGLALAERLLAWFRKH
jgi:hypothetical protein